MNKKNQFALIAITWGHKGSLEHLSDMGSGLYTRYCLGDDYSKSAKDFKEMSELCEQLKNGLYSEKVATEVKRDESPNHFALSLELGTERQSGAGSMNINAEEGDKVVFAFPDSGMGNGAYAAKHLELGKTYTVKYVDIGGWQSDVYLKEIPDKSFNSVHFADVETPS